MAPGYNGHPGYGWGGPGFMPYGNGMGMGMGPGFMPYGNGMGMGMGPGVGPGMTPGMAPGMGASPQALGAAQQQAAMAGLGLGGYPAAQQRGAQPQLQPTPTVISGRPVDGAPDWAAYTAPDGRTYYYNAKTGVSAWEKPGSPAPAAPLGLLGSFGSY